MESATSTIEKNMPSTRESLRNEFVKFLGSLKFMHDNSFVHRDLKPANIFIVDGKIKLGDFGLAEYMRWGRPPGANNIAGTPHTIAPEVWLNPNQADLYRADIYSAGITMAWRAQIASDPAHPDAFTKRVSRYSENFGYGGEMYKVFTYDTSNFRWDFWGGYDQILLNGVRDLRSRKVLVSSEMSRIFRWMTSENIFQRGNLEQRILELHQIKIVLLLHSLKQRWGLLNPKLQQFPVWIQNGLHPPLQAVLN